MPRQSDPERRAAILAAARAVFLTQGYGRAKMAEIAERAGVASGTVYLYFRSKEALAAALADDFFARLDAMLQPLFSEASPPEAIAQAVETTLRFAAEEHDLLRLLRLSVGLSASRQPIPARERLLQALAAALQRHMAAGNIRQYEPQILAGLIVGLIEWVAETIVLRDLSDYRPYSETVIRLLEQALLPASGDAGRHR